MTTEPQSQETCCLTPQEVETLWRTEGLELTPTQLLLLPEIKRWLGRRRNNPLADYLTGKPVESFPKDITLELTADVLARFRPQERGIATVALLTKIIDRGNAEGLFILCPPPIAVLVRRQPSPFRSERWPMLEVATILREILANSIRKPLVLARKSTTPEQIAQITLGQTLLCAILHGGLIATSVLEALLRRIDNPEQTLLCLGNRLFAELPLGSRNQASGEFRRWFPDPLSAILISNLPTGIVKIALGDKAPDPDGMKPLIWRCIRAFVRSVGDTGVLPKTLHTLLDAVRLDMESHIPVYLANYAACQFVCHSLKPSVYRRLHGLTVEPDLDKEESHGSVADLGGPGNGIQQDVEITGDVEPRWLTRLRVAMKGDDRKQIINNIQELLNAPEAGFNKGDVGELFAGFARRMFAVSNANHVTMAVSTARAVALSVSIRLGGLVGHDISQFGTQEWIGLYEEALSDAETPGIRRKLVRALKDFQRYLELDRGVAPIDGSEVFPSASGLVPVDANIISEAEFQQIRQQFTEGIAKELPNLADQRDDGNLARVAWLILTLAYRCGLRRMEVLKLDLADIIVHDQAAMLVRPTESRRLKSKSSTRMLPLHALLTQEELDQLRQWVESRKLAEEHEKFSPFLFALPNRGFLFVPQDTLFKLLHRIMREVTADPSVRFHHLRHSFASRTYIVLAASAGQYAQRICSTLPGYAEPLAQADALRRQLFGHNQMTRRDVWAVCSLLGHSNPDVSVEHYIHHLDIALAESLAQSIAPDTAVVIAASGASSAQAYRHLQDSTLDEWVAHLHRKRFKEIEEPHSAEQPISKVQLIPSATSTSDAADSLLSIWQLLWQIQVTQRSLADMSDIHGIPSERIQLYLERAICLSNLKKSEKGDKFRHRFMEWAPDARHPEQTKRIPVPIKPHENRDLAVISRLAATFRDSYAQNKALFRQMVSLYANEALTNFGGLIFKNHEKPDSARNFLQFLKFLGCKNDEIEFVSFDVTTERSRHAARWRSALEMRSIPMKKTAPLNGNDSWACPWLGIQPIFSDEHGKKMGSAGFRFVMVMAAIAIGFSIEGT